MASDTLLPVSLHVCMYVEVLLFEPFSLFQAFALLTRDELDLCQEVSHQWHQVILANEGILPLRRIEVVYMVRLINLKTSADPQREAFKSHKWRDLGIGDT